MNYDAAHGRCDMTRDDAMPTDGTFDAPAHGVLFAEATRTFGYIGLNSFGGPTGQIALMHRVLVEEKKWVSEDRFAHALNLCMLLPGPEAMQLAVYVGWLLHRTRGGIVAGVLFVLPGFVAILALSILYTSLGHIAPVQGLLFGLKAAVLAIVVEAVIRIGKRVLRGATMYAIAAATFVAIFVFQASFPVVIGVAALIGLVGGWKRPDVFAVMSHRKAAGGVATTRFATDLVTSDHTRPTMARTLAVLGVWLPLWLVPVIGLRWWLGAENVFAAQGVFFSKAAAVTFGGAYAVLAYVAQQAVEVYGWLRPDEMLTGLGLAETTPGPLILVLQFVAYMGAHRDAGPLHPMVAGVLASALAAWTTFVPCFLWIFLGAPYMEAIRGKRILTAALTCITAAVVGVVLNLAVWFGVHTLFGRVEEATWGWMRVPMPRVSSLDYPALVIAVLAGVLLLRVRWGVVRTLGVCAAAGIVWRLMGPG